MITLVLCAALAALVAPQASPAPAASAPPFGGTPVPTATASAVATSAPAPLRPAVSATSDPAGYPYRFVPHQPAHPAAGVPAIYAVYLNTDKLRSLGPIRIKVTTSPDVVKVVSRNGSREGAIPFVAPGDFEANSKLPKLPFIAEGSSLDLQFVATGPTGLKTTVSVPVKLQ